jgi:hypothetical protein
MADTQVTDLVIYDVNYRNNPFGRQARPTRENGAIYNSNFGSAVYRTPRDGTSRRIVNQTMKYTDLSNANLVYAPIDITHYGNDFVRKFLDQTFADDYDIGKSSVYRSHEDINKDTLK